MNANVRNKEPLLKNILKIFQYLFYFSKTKKERSLKNFCFVHVCMAVL